MSVHTLCMFYRTHTFLFLVETEPRCLCVSCQACYGIQKVPKGSWLCRICALGILPKCQLCPKKGGAMKPTRSGTKWVHVSCALWIPEVKINAVASQLSFKILQHKLELEAASLVIHRLIKT